MVKTLTSGLKTIINKIYNTTSIVKEIEYHFFLPVNKLSHRSITYKNFVANGNVRIVETEYGSIEIRNRLLNERHKDIIIAIIKNSEIQVMPDGNICAVFRYVDVLRELKMGDKNTHQLKSDIKVISDANFVIKFGSKEKSMRIFTKLFTDNEKNMQGVILDKDYVLMYKHNFSADYKELFEKITEIPYPALKTIVHYLIVKSAEEEEMSNTFSLDTVLNRIGFPSESPSSFKEVKKNLNLYSSQLKEHFNIDYDPKSKIFTTTKHEGVQIYQPIADISYKNYISKKINYRGEKYEIIDIKELPGNKWIIETKSEKIELYFYKDDFLFLLEVVTTSNDDVKKYEKVFPSLFDM